ncbi:host specificity factor TipJ family phage tail protein [Pectobacterium zantedeschiae]|uniref:host specificity factor TipJ family phage tail protein n=1 Tax=Pectobacterium zantedeschiae TaxID=2034769 RepID=UPI0032EE1E4C
MPKIKIVPMPGIQSKTINIDTGKDIRNAIDLANPFHADAAVLLNGVVLSDDFDIQYQLKPDDVLTIVDQPKGGLIKTLLNPLEHFNPIKFTKKVMGYLIKQPSSSFAADINSKTSSNNSIKAQTNTARNGEARPDNFGLVRSFPDLIQSGLTEYIDNDQYVTQWMNFGLGRYTVSSIRYSETNIGAMPGSSYHIYQPGELIPEIIQPVPFDDVDGQEVPGANESPDFPAETATTNEIVSGVIEGNEALVKIEKNSDFDYFYDLDKPHSVTVILNVTYTTASGSVTKDVTLSANITGAQTTDEGELVDPVEYYEFTFSNLSGSDYDQLPANTTVNTTLFTINDNEALVVGPMYSPVASEHLWINFKADLENNANAQVKITWVEVDDDNNEIPGTTETKTITITNSTGKTDSIYKTEKITPLSGNGRFAIDFQRPDNSSDSNKLTIESISSVSMRENVVYPDDTIITIRIRGNKNATQSRQLKFNALINRHVISYDRSNGLVDYTERPSRSFADIVLHNWLVTGRQDVSSIDIDALYEIYDGLPDARLGYFDYTFDDEDTSLGERIKTICDAATVTAYGNNGVLSFSRDEKKTTPATVFTRSNLKPDNYSLSFDVSLPGTYDGVIVKFRNPSTNKQDFVRLKIVNGEVIEGVPEKGKSFDMLYIRNRYQAYDRAMKEALRIIHSRMSMTVTAMGDGEWVNLGDMIQVPDLYDENQQQGYIISRNGNEFETNERIIFSGDSLYVVITDSMGNPYGNVIAIPREDTPFGFIADIPDVQLNLWDGKNIQSPSRFIIASTSELLMTKWNVTDKSPNNDGTTSLTLAEYSDSIHEYTVS